MSHETETGSWPQFNVGADRGGSNSSLIQIESSKLLPVILICCVMASVAIVGFIFEHISTQQLIDQMRVDYSFQIEQLSKKVQAAEVEARVAQDDVTNYVKRGHHYKEQ